MVCRLSAAQNALLTNSKVQVVLLDRQTRDPYLAAKQ
jgi:hypothetical protein